MLTEAELLKLIQTMESEHVERTVTKQNKDTFSEAICAFANDVHNSQ